MGKKALSCCAALLALAAIAFVLTRSHHEAKASGAATGTATLTVQGMTCGACATSVKVVLEKLDGVSEARVHFDEKRAVVRYDPSKVTPGRMAEAIRATLPYEASVLPASAAGEVPR